MPPTAIHFNGSLNLPDANTVMREIAARVPRGLARIPDGETGNRQQWIFFQLEKFWATPGLEQAAIGALAPGYDGLPKVRLAEAARAQDLEWPNLGYADAYAESYSTFVQLREQGVIPDGVRFQVEYPTPLASISSWVVEEQQVLLEASYERALFADLQRLLSAVPHDRIAVQWDVAVEFAVLESASGGRRPLGLDEIVERLARCVEQIPVEVPVGLHLCYGDYLHRHFKEPSSLAKQVEVVHRLNARARRSVTWFAFTVPQYQRDPAYFAPLRSLRVPPRTELYFALVPYHPDEQEPGTTDEQVRLIDAYLVQHPGNGGVRWGICTECGMARADREEIPRLLDLHREILDTYRPAAERPEHAPASART